MGRMGAAHLAAQGGGFEPQRKTDYELHIAGVGGWDSMIVLAVKSFALPTQESAEVDLAYLNEFVHVAGPGKFSGGDVVCHDYIDQAVWNTLQEWRKEVYDPETGIIGLAATYKKQGDCIFMGPDGSAERKYKMVGLWPKSLKGDNLAYGDTETYSITMSLCCDRAWLL